MRITLLDESFIAESGVSRSSGIHLTDVIDGLLESLGAKPDYGNQDEVTRQAQFEKGFIWERLLSRAFGERAAVRVGEISLDGITGSPDGITYNYGDLAIEEYKCTAFSSSRTPDTIIRWMMQVKGYCKMVDATMCIFRVLYLNGNYGDTRTPIPVSYRIKFTQGELNENWLAIMNFAKSKGWI